MADGNITYATANNVCFIKLTGRVSHILAGGFDWLHTKLTADAELKGVVIDMTETPYADSTTFGMLAKIARFHLKRFNVKPMLVCAHPEVVAILDSMDFGQVFQLVEELGDAAPEFSAVPDAAFQPPDAKQLWEAHKILSDMSARNKAEFCDVMAILEAEME